MFSAELQTFLADDLIEQFSPESVVIIEKVFAGEKLSEAELAELLTPNEAAVLLSAKYRQPVKRRYVKELARAVPSRKTDHVTPARLAPDRIISRTHMYRVSKVLAVPMRAGAGEKDALLSLG
jgi:hypothetical protein